MINGNGGKCKSTANKYALSATDLPGEHLALMESGNTLIHSAGIINTQFLHDMDAVAMNRFMSNAEQGGNTLIITWDLRAPAPTPSHLRATVAIKGSFRGAEF